MWQVQREKYRKHTDKRREFPQHKRVVSFHSFKSKDNP
jgi:hypothetical protein